MRLKEHKLHARKLVKISELIEKTKLNTFSINTLYEALLLLSEQLKNDKEVEAA